MDKLQRLLNLGLILLRRKFTGHAMCGPATGVEPQFAVSNYVLRGYPGSINLLCVKSRSDLDTLIAVQSIGSTPPTGLLLCFGMHQCKLHLGPGAAEARPLTTQPVQQGQIAAHRAANRVRVQARNAVEGPIRMNLCHPARAKVRVHARNTVEDAEVDQEQPQATGFSAAVQRLLHRAASTLTRGTTTCLTCRGQGTCSCPACNVSIDLLSH